ncbi:hypothetical protein AVEN_78286-1, partial [Araneus ventricosus]
MREGESNPVRGGGRPHPVLLPVHLPLHLPGEFPDVRGAQGLPAGLLRPTITPHAHDNRIRYGHLLKLLVAMETQRLMFFNLII